MLTNVQVKSVSLGHRSLLSEFRFTADLDGLPVVIGGEGSSVAWIESADGTAWEHVADDDREGYLVGETFVDCDVYTAAWKQADGLVLDLNIAARESLEVWASTVVADRVAV